MRHLEVRCRSSEACSTSYARGPSYPRSCVRQIACRLPNRTVVRDRRNVSACSASEEGSRDGSTTGCVTTAPRASVVSAEIEAPSSNQGLQQIQTQVEQLSSLVKAQQDLLDKQERTLAALKTEESSAETAAPAASPASGASESKAATHPLVSAWARQAPTWREQNISPFESQRIGIGDRRLLGLYDSRFHSTAAGATPKDFRVLPDRIFLVRHAESEGNVDNSAYSYIPDSQVPLTDRGHDQARSAGQRMRSLIEKRSGKDYKLFFYTSPYKRSLQTYESIAACFGPDNIMGVQEEVQLREQDFGNFQDVEGKQHEKAERLRFGRFFYRFPNGESGADVYDRITIFEDHMIRDINAGRFANKTSLVLVTHGLALRVFLMRWFHWTLAQYLMVHNPPNAEPLVLERVPNDADSRPGGTVAWMHTKALYRLSDESMSTLRGCTSDMCSTNIMPRVQSSGLMSGDYDNGRVSS